MTPPLQLSLVHLLLLSTQAWCFSSFRAARRPGLPFLSLSQASSDTALDNAPTIEEEADWVDSLQLSSSGLTSWLVCGDGDLSYSASIAPVLKTHNVTLTASVLESRESHNNVYQSSRLNIQTIVGAGHVVQFEVDATKLEEQRHMRNKKFDRIQFNFPHWRGKTNNRRNRVLLNEFLQSSNQVLNSSGGRLWISLCDKQGGSEATDLQQWKQSWLVAMYAAEAGMMLMSTSSYTPLYNLSSHRGVDRPFWIGKRPMLYQFGFPQEGRVVPKELQLCCRHELHVMLPTRDDARPCLSGDDIVLSRESVLHGDAIQRFVQKHAVPQGIKVDVPLRECLNNEMAVFLIVYRGAEIQLTREAADSYRQRLETKIGQVLDLRENRLGRLVSRPFPHSALESILANAPTTKL